MTQESKQRISRRGLLGVSATAAVLTTLPAAASATTPAPARAAFKLSLNTSTIRGQNLPLDEEIEVAIAAGYDGIEPWIGKIEAYIKAGGALDDMRKRCADAGLAVVSAIGFANWIVDDNGQRAKALEQAKRDMGLVAALGGTHIAAPPAGANKAPLVNLDAAAERYHALCEIGRNAGVIPQVEVWGFSTNLSKLAESTYVAIASGHPDACVLADAYHLYKGGNAAAGVRALSRSMTHCFHINDYPDIERGKISDADRVMPGDGVAPLHELLGAMRDNACEVYLSLELFNRGMWKRDALEVAQEGLLKTRRVLAGL